MSPGVFDQIRRGHRCIKINEQVKKGRYLLPGGRREGSVDFGWVSIKVAVKWHSIFYSLRPFPRACAMYSVGHDCSPLRSPWKPYDPSQNPQIPLPSPLRPSGPSLVIHGSPRATPLFVFGWWPEGRRLKLRHSMAILRSDPNWIISSIYYRYRLIFNNEMVTFASVVGFKLWKHQNKHSLGFLNKKN